MRRVLALLIWLIDFLLKVALGYALAFAIWLPYSLGTGVTFGPGWAIAGGVFGACINGLFEGCDLILLGWAKRVAGDR